MPITLTSVSRLRVTINLGGPANNPPNLVGGTSTPFKNAFVGQELFDVNDVLGGDLDLDGEAIIYSITGGNGLGIFGVDVNTGIVSIANDVPIVVGDFDLDVMGADGAGGTDTATVTITFQDFDDTPVPAEAAPNFTLPTAPYLWEPSIHASTVSVTADTTQIVRTNFNFKQFLGLNHPSGGAGIQTQDAWDTGLGQFKGTVNAYLQTYFQDTSQRFPGGLHANVWRFTANNVPIGSRPVQANWYGGTFAPVFSTPEWLNLCQSLGWPPVRWVLNLLTLHPTDIDTFATVQELADEAKLLATWLAANYSGTVFSFQLSNELDRTHPEVPALPFTAQEIADRANAVIREIRQIIPQAEFNIFTQVHTIAGTTYQQHMAALAAAIDFECGFSIFQYVAQSIDNASYNPPFNHTHVNLRARGYSPLYHADAAQKITDQSLVVYPTKVPRIEVAEYGRQETDLNGQPDLKVKEMSNAYAGLSNSFMVLHNVLNPNIHVMEMHASAGNRWNIGNWRVGGNLINTAIPENDPLPHMDYLAVIGRIPTVNILASYNTTTDSSNPLNYEGYDSFAVIMHETATDTYYVLAANRTRANLSIKINIPPLAGLNVKVERLYAYKDGDPEQLDAALTNKELDTWTVQGADPTTADGGGGFFRNMLASSIQAWRIKETTVLQGFNTLIPSMEMPAVVDFVELAGPQPEAQWDVPTQSAPGTTHFPTSRTALLTLMSLSGTAQAGDTVDCSGFTLTTSSDTNFHNQNGTAANPILIRNLNVTQGKIQIWGSNLYIVKGTWTNHAGFQVHLRQQSPGNTWDGGDSGVIGCTFNNCSGGVFSEKDRSLISHNTWNNCTGICWGAPTTGGLGIDCHVHHNAIINHTGSISPAQSVDSTGTLYERNLWDGVTFAGAAFNIKGQHNEACLNVILNAPDAYLMQRGGDENLVHNNYQQGGHAMRGNGNMNDHFHNIAVLSGTSGGFIGFLLSEQTTGGGDEPGAKNGKIIGNLMYKQGSGNFFQIYLDTKGQTIVSNASGNTIHDNAVIGDFPFVDRGGDAGSQDYATFQVNNPAFVPVVAYDTPNSGRMETGGTDITFGLDQTRSIDSEVISVDSGISQVERQLRAETVLFSDMTLNVDQGTSVVDNGNVYETQAQTLNWTGNGVGFVRYQNTTDFNWTTGDEIVLSMAVFLPTGFFAAQQEQISLMRYDNFSTQGAAQDQCGLVFASSGQLVLVKQNNQGAIYEEQTPRFTLAENTWHYIALHQNLHDVDANARNRLYINKALVADTTGATIFAGKPINRMRFGIVSVGGSQTNALTMNIEKPSILIV